MHPIMTIIRVATLVIFPAFAMAQEAVPTNLSAAQSRWVAADAELNTLWKRCIDPSSRTVQSIAALRDAQKTWAAFRDLDARAYQLGESSRRPLDDLYYVHARTVMTQSRIAELKALFGCE